LAFEPQPQQVKLGKSMGGLVVGSDAPAARAASADLLLVLDDDTLRSQPRGDEHVAVDEPTDSDIAELDEFFASLAEWEPDLSLV
jgi:hypothetical protein